MTPVAVPVKLPAVNAVHPDHEIGVADTLVVTKKTTSERTKLVVIGVDTFGPCSEHLERGPASSRPFSCTAQISGLPAACKSPNSVSAGLLRRPLLRRRSCGAGVRIRSFTILHSTGSPSLPEP